MHFSAGQCCVTFERLVFEIELDGEVGPEMAPAISFVRIIQLVTFQNEPATRKCVFE